MISSAFRADSGGAVFVEADPDSVLDYSVSFADWLGSDTISTATWSADPGITVTGAAVNVGSITDRNGKVHPANTVATATLSGGSAGSSYQVRVRVVTAGGRTDDRTFEYRVRQR